MLDHPELLALHLACYRVDVPVAHPVTHFGPLELFPAYEVRQKPTKEVRVVVPDDVMLSRYIVDVVRDEHIPLTVNAVGTVVVFLRGFESV